MPFEAIVHAPTLRVGARLNIAEADQTESARPKRLGVGEELRLRLGCCSPGYAHGRIIGYSVDPERAVMAVGTEFWMLHRGGGAGVSTPGLISESWYVAAKHAAPASPPDHSRSLSTGLAAAKG